MFLYVAHRVAGDRPKLPQVLENMCMRGSVECDSIILSDFAMLCAIPLRDGCDVLDVIGKRLGNLSL
ncbi:hypothetical protein ACIP8I_22805 [Pseudomonas sp. NPDC088414]|uniref:hypothetical protein n=1 Tax=Pseudomonas sp. NPDC088414 TaxID=3364454 RepID=UPI00380E0759